MSIIIRNLGGDPDTPIRRYEIRINKTVITHFTHDRNLGLAMCLKKAAQAASIQGQIKLIDEERRRSAWTFFEDTIGNIRRYIFKGIAE